MEISCGGWHAAALTGQPGKAQNRANGWARWGVLTLPQGVNYLPLGGLLGALLTTALTCGTGDRAGLTTWVDHEVVQASRREVADPCLLLH